MVVYIVSVAQGQVKMVTIIKNVFLTKLKWTLLDLCFNTKKKEEEI